MNYGQELRPESERNLPDWQRNALDSRRALDEQRQMENPGLYDRLDRIERKLDRLLREPRGPFD